MNRKVGAGIIILLVLASYYLLAERWQGEREVKEQKAAALRHCLIDHYGMCEDKFCFHFPDNEVCKDPTSVNPFLLFKESTLSCYRNANSFCKD